MANAQHSRSTGHGHTQDEVNLELDDSQSLRQLEEGHQPPILVLSRDPNLVETVKKAAPRGVPVAFAPDLDHVAERLSTLKPGVLVADTASTADVASMAAQLTQHFPELVVVVAGKREENAQLMQLTATGRIFRFLLTPLSHGATRLSLEAAVKQHLDLAAAGERLSTGSSSGEGGSKNYVMIYGALAAGLLVVIGGIWFGVSQFTSEPEVPPIVNQPAAQQPSGVPERPDPVKAELALAKDAFNQNKFIEPQGESALDLYRSALALDPNSQEAKDGIRSVAEKILERAEAALLAERLEEAIRTIETARDIDSTHPRLAFLDAQVARERERLQLNQAQEVGNRVRSLVSAANDRMANGRLLTPRNGNAQDALLEARRLDPTNPVVLSTIRELSNQLTEEARKSLAAGNLDAASNYVQGAREMGSAGSALAAVERALAEANRNAAAGSGPSAAPSTPAPQAASTRRPATSAPAASQAGAGPNIDSMVAEVRQRLNEGKLIDPPGASARDSLNALRTAAPNRAEVEELSRTLSTRLLDSGRGAMNAKAFDRSAQLIAAAKDVGQRYNGAAISQAENDLAAARDANSQETSIVSAASLKRVRMVSPVYPDAARKRGIEGWVELAFTVQTNGSVNDVEVRNASPADVFEDAAVRAVRQWRFEPVEKNGEVIEQRAMVRLKFSQAN